MSRSGSTRMQFKPSAIIHFFPGGTKSLARSYAQRRRLDGRRLKLSNCATFTKGIVMSGRAPADQGLFFGVALVASAVMSSAFFCGE